uniref:G-protein coupled receptors family 1 profile domain-containing protein n=1 Tax=Heliothis virescens TaxID=7102 RepID=A0A2A4J614_HELVI
MSFINESDFENNSFSIFGPLGMAFYDDGHVLEDTYTVKVVVSVILGFFMVVSVIGNVCTLAVIARERTMRTPTNCYLANLAITDLLTALFIPLEIYVIFVPDFYPLGEVGCRIHFVLWDILSNCSLLIITAFTIERYIIVTRPFLRQKLTLNSRVFKIVGVIWALSLCFGIPDAFYIDFLERKEYVFCYYTLTKTVSIVVAFEIFLFFLIPMTTILVLYIKMTIKLRSAQKKLRSSPVVGKQNRDKAVKMIAAVAFSFFLSWAPYCIFRVMTVLPKFKYEDYYNVWKVINYLCYNGYMSTAANPILYSLMSRKFRQAFKDLLKSPRVLSGSSITQPTKSTHDSVV